MASQGSVIARVYTSDAVLPLAQVPVIFSQLHDGTETVLSVRMTNSSGLTEPLFIDTPDQSVSFRPGLPSRPYTLISISAEAPGYNTVRAADVQIFPGVQTIQGLRLQPVSANEPQKTQTVSEPAQNL